MFRAANPRGLAKGSEAILFVRPEKMRLLGADADADNSIAARVTRRRITRGGRDLETAAAQRDEAQSPSDATHGTDIARARTRWKRKPSAASGTMLSMRAATSLRVNPKITPLKRIFSEPVKSG